MKKFFMFITASLCTLMLHAQWTADSLSNLKVKDGSGTEEVVPLQATTDDGYTYISWFESNGGNYKLMMQLLDKEGNKLWGDDGLTVSTHPTGSALYVYDLAVDYDGNAIVAFQDERNVDLMPVAYKLDQSGNFIWGPDGIVLHDSSATFELAPAIGVLSNNDVVIAWNATATKKWIAFQKITSDGNVSWSAAKTIKSNSKNYSRAQFAEIKDGTILISYIQETGSFPSITSTIFVDHVDADGNPLWASPTKASTFSTSFFEWPAVISDGHGGAFVAFNSGAPGNLTIIDAFVQHIDSDGNKVLGPDGAEVAVFTDNHRSLSGISYLSDSDQLGVALKVLDNAQGQAGIYVQKLDASGNRLWGDTGYELLPLSSNDYHEPFGIQRANDAWMIAYTEGSVTSQEFKVVKFDLNGNLIWNRVISAVGSNKYDATMGNYKNDELAVVWEDERNGSGVYAQNIGGDGHLGVIATAVSDMPVFPADLFPTLAHDQIFLACDERFINGQFRISDLNGSTMLSQSITREHSQINISALPDGIYFYSVRNGSAVQTGKFCKQ